VIFVLEQEVGLKMEAPALDSVRLNIARAIGDGPTPPERNPKHTFPDMLEFSGHNS
jgi:hypothetical protein